MEKHLLTVFLYITIVCLSGALFKVHKDLKDTVNVVYWLNDKLDNSYLMIDSLNKEITNNWNELEEKKQFERLIKDLR